MVVGIAVVNYGSSELLAENLVVSQRDAEAAGVEVVVVVLDNFSTDAECRRLRELADRHGWVLIMNERNAGFGDGANLAMARAFESGASEVLLLNPDARIDGASLSALRAAVAHRRMTIAAPLVLTSDGRVWFGGSDLYLADGATRSVAKRADHPGADTVPWLSGACLIFTREAFDAVSFEPDYFLYWEDVDLSWRAQQSGIDLVVVDTATAVHDAGGTQQTSGGRAKSRTYYFYNARNRLMFAAENLDDDRLRDWLKSTPAATWQILLRGGRKQLARDPGLAWAAIRGALAGRRMVMARLRGRR